MDVARLNFSHGTHESHRTLYETVRHVSRSVGRPVAVMQDLMGPRIRLGKLDGGAQELVVGQEFELVGESLVGDASRASTSYEYLARDVELGQSILIADGRIRLKVVEITETGVKTTVAVPGTIHNFAGLNLPQTGLTSSALTTKDLKDIEFGLDVGVDYVALSFVSAVLDIHQLRSKLGRTGRCPHIIAKIERPRAVAISDDLVEAADGVMIARGDLGVELPPERVPLLQKEIINRANSLGKTAITATQMLESMHNSPIPTRAEASDVANAVLDGTDAVMLSGETAKGEYPIQSVEMMDRIIREVEGSNLYRRLQASNARPALSSFANAVAMAATAAADELDARAICAFTGSGRTARLVKTHRPAQNILAITPDEHVYHRLAMHWGTQPVLVDSCRSTAELVEQMERVLRKKVGATDGEVVVMVMGVPIGSGAEPNAIKLHRIGENLDTTGSWDVADGPDNPDGAG